MTASALRDKIDNMVSHIAFQYQDKPCGVDPISKTHFDMWCGDNAMTVDGLDAVMETDFFLGRSLSDIAPDINIDY